MLLNFIQNNSTRDYITSIELMGTKVIPSDSFDIGDNEYVLLRIKKSTENQMYLDILCIKGSDIGSRYLTPASEFENKTLAEIQKALSEYQSH